jgi:hypothetical protein
LATVKNEDCDLGLLLAVREHIEQRCSQIHQGGVGKQECGGVLDSKIEPWAEKSKLRSAG